MSDPETVSSNKIEVANATPGFTDEEYFAAHVEDACYPYKDRLGAALALENILKAKIEKALGHASSTGSAITKLEQMIAALQ